MANFIQVQKLDKEGRFYFFYAVPTIVLGVLAVPITKSVLRLPSTVSTSLTPWSTFMVELGWKTMSWVLTHRLYASGFRMLRVTSLPFSLASFSSVSLFRDSSILYKIKPRPKAASGTSIFAVTLGLPVDLMG